MDRKSSEKPLLISYVICSLTGITVCITTGIAWGHWKLTLDQCIGRNCSCILYGEYTPSKFLGGDAAPCIWVTFGPILYILYTVSMAIFHGYRILFNTETTHTRTVMKKNEDGQVVEMRTVQTSQNNDLSKTFWLIVSIISVIFVLYSTVHSAIFLDGYYTTCDEYRKALEKLLGVHGTAIPVIHNRLQCQSIFDFMDYMQPDSGNTFRDGFINTGLDLIVGIVAAFISLLSFLIISFINIKKFRNSS